VEAVRVLLVQLDDVARGFEYAVKVDEPAVWSEVAHVQLAKGQVNDAIEAYIRAGDCSKHVQVGPGQLVWVRGALHAHRHLHASLQTLLHQHLEHLQLEAT
jgi:hypothetical protein